MNKIKQEAEKRMQKALSNLQNTLTKIRTGRANVSLLDHIQVDYYGNSTPLNQLANIIVSDSRTLLVTPWEKAMVATVEKAILTADLGLNPVTAGSAIRVPMPSLTEERRKEMIKVVKAEAEHCRVAVRNIRRDANNQLKELEKNKAISPDEEHRANEQIQKLTNDNVVDIDALLAAKEKDLLAV